MNMIEASNTQVQHKVDLSRVVAEAWALTSGFKGTYWIAAIVSTVLLIVLESGVELLLPKEIGAVSQILSFILWILIFAIQVSLMSGLMMISIHRCRGELRPPKDIFSYFKSSGNLILAHFAMVLLIGLGLLLFIIPGIYLMLGYVFVIPLIVDKQLSVWDAMETSRRAVTTQWFTYLGWFLVVGLVSGILSLFIVPIIWTVPFASLAYAVLYKRTFG